MSPSPDSFWRGYVVGVVFCVVLHPFAHAFVRWVINGGSQP